MFVSICFRGDCKGWGYNYLGTQSSCPSDINNKWKYYDGASWVHAHDGLSVRCIGEEGEYSLHDAQILIHLTPSVR